MKNILTFSLCLFLFLDPIFGQHNSVLKGTVTDQDGIPVEDVQVELLNTAFSASTDKSGNFFISNVPYGQYVVSLNKAGFAAYVENIDMDTDSETLQLVLESEMNRLGTVTVTAQKREEVIQEIPLSITSLSYGEVKEGQVQNTNDLTAISPNLFASDPGDRRSVISIRGIVSTSYDPAVTTYIDGVNQFNLDTYIPQLFDVERIEVLRGPQGTLYGRNAMGGVINILTRKPERKTSIFGELSFGNYERKRVLAGLKVPLGNQLLFGAAALYEERDGFYTNEFTASSYDDQKNFSGNYFLDFLISPAWEASLNFKHYFAENEGAFPLNSSMEAAFEKPYTLNQNQVSTMRDQTFNTSLVFEYKGRDINFSSQTAYQQNYRYYEDPIDADFSPLDAISIFNNYGRNWNNVKVFTQEFEISSASGGDGDLEWTAGSFLFHQKSPTRQATRFGEDAGLLGMEETNFSLISTTEAIATGAAVFGQINYPLSENLDLMAGLRYDYEKKEQRILGEYQGFSDPQPVYEFQADTTGQADFYALSPKAGLTYMFSEQKLVFGTYSRGFRAGGLTPLSSDPSQPPLYKFKPEFSSNFEVGSKNVLLEGKLFLNLTLFYMEVTDVQVPTLVLPEAITITRNSGELHSKGVEFEMKTLLFPGLEFSYDFGYTDASYETLEVAGDGVTRNLEGNKQIFTPETTSMLALQYDRKFGSKDSWGLFVRGEWKHLGRQYFDLANTLVQDPYSLFNSQVGLSYEDWKMTFWGRNIFDKRYISYGYNFGAVRLGDPALYGATVSVVL